MLRQFFVAGIDREEYAEAWSDAPYWLLNASTLCRADGELPWWIEPYIHGRSVLWDPGTFGKNAMEYAAFLYFVHNTITSFPGRQMYLQYDEPGRADATLYYLQDMLSRGYDPIPIIQPGMDPDEIPRLWEQWDGGWQRMISGEGGRPTLFLGGLVHLQRRAGSAACFEHLNQFFYPGGKARAWLHDCNIHFGGITNKRMFARYPATSGDSTSWMFRAKKDRIGARGRPSIAALAQRYGDQHFPAPARWHMAIQEHRIDEEEAALQEYIEAEQRELAEDEKREMQAMMEAAGRAVERGVVYGPPAPGGWAQLYFPLDALHGADPVTATHRASVTTQLAVAAALPVEPPFSCEVSSMACVGCRSVLQSAPPPVPRAIAAIVRWPLSGSHRKVYHRSRCDVISVPCVGCAEMGGELAVRSA